VTINDDTLDASGLESKLAVENGEWEVAFVKGSLHLYQAPYLAIPFNYQYSSADECPLAWAIPVVSNTFRPSICPKKPVGPLAPCQG
jgi:hypothetical protein